MWDVNELAPYLEQRKFSTNHPTKKYEKEWTSKWVDFTKENEKTRRNILLLKIKIKKRVQVFCQTDIVRHIRSQTVDVKKKLCDNIVCTNKSGERTQVKLSQYSFSMQ